MQPWTETRVRNERAADLLVDRGYQEAITYSFTEPATQALLFPGAAFALANPISAELGVMRMSLWPGLLQALARAISVDSSSACVCSKSVVVTPAPTARRPK